MPDTSKREFLTGLGVLAGVAALPPALAQAAAPTVGLAPPGKTLPNRMVKTTKLFKAPGFYPNGLALAPEGLALSD